MKSLAQQVAILAFVAVMGLFLSACGAVGSNCGGSIGADPITVSLVQSGTATTLYAGSSAVALTASVANDKTNAGVTWSFTPASGCGTLTVAAVAGMNAVYTPPKELNSDCSVSITVTSVADREDTATLALSVKSVLSITQSGTTTILNAGSATVTLTTSVNAGVTWSLNPASGCGALTGSAAAATYTPPGESSLNADCTATITATSLTDTANSNGIGFTIRAVAIALSSGESQKPVVAADAPAPLSLSASIVNDASGSAALNWNITGSSPAGEQITASRPSSRNVSARASAVKMRQMISNCGTLSDSAGTAGAAVTGPSVTYTPPTAGPCTATVTASASVNPNVTLTFTITVNAALAISTSSLPLPAGTYYVSYAAPQLTATGGIQGSGYTWSGSNLPPGLTLSSDGYLLGTPTVIGSYSPLITVTDGNSPPDTATQSLPLTVGPKPLTVAGLSASDKVYDGTTSAILTGTPVLSGGVVNGDTITLSGTPVGNFASKDAGSGIAVTVSGLSLTGASAGNYTLAEPAALTATINPKALTVTGLSANNKVYDGTTAATLTGTPVLSGSVVNGDTVTLSGTPVGTFASRLVGNDIPVTVSGLFLTGPSAGNYTLVEEAGLTADITPGTNPTYTVSGRISLINGGGALLGATISLGGALTATTGSDGSYSILEVPGNATYTLTPSYTFPAGSDPADSAVFYPASQSLTVGGDLTGQNFTADLGYTVSGTAVYTGSVITTSELYVNLQNTVCTSCSPLGTSTLFLLPGPYSFTIHGVTPGAYTLQSWFDLSGYGAPNIADPVSSGNAVTVAPATGDVPNVSVTLNDPSSWADLTTMPAPSMTVSPTLDKGVIVYYQAITNAGVEQATRYNLCWSSITGGGSDSDCQHAHPTYGGALSLTNGDAFWADSGTGKIVILDGGDINSLFYTKSQPAYKPADGDQYSFCLQGVNGDEVPGPWTCQDVTLAAPPTSSTGGTSTLAMSVKTPVKAAGAIYSGCYDPVGNALYVHADDSRPSAGTHSYTVYGIPSSVANCNVVSAMDQNNDGIIAPLNPYAGSAFGGSGDVFNLGRNSTLTALTVGGTTTAPLLDLTPYQKNSSATLTTQNNLDPVGNESYSVNFDVRPLMRLPVGLALTSGTEVLQPIDFAPGCATCGQGEFNVTVSTANQAPSGSYTLAVSDESTAASPATDTPTLAVSNVVADFATNLLATGGATPTFTWLYPVNNTSAYTYQFTLWDAGGNVISQVPAKAGTGFASTTANSITPSVTLTSGATYTWAITTIDSNGNTAQQQATYIP
jgi:phosphotransferase system IIA component